ncbi:DUF998 domain-containing protein [Streptomyces sp. NPDC050658]|uniref:DUF998 domain-containing protein n=1 Tax=unclassified Streptomyces TaxID=2593676 RepID=UPI00344973F8
MGEQVILACGVAAGPLFTVVYLLAGAKRVDYKPLRHPVGSLALGRAGWVQTADFPDLLSLITFLALAMACFVSAPSDSPGWAVYSIASGVLFAATMALASAAFGQNQRLANFGGLIQRIAITIGWTWLALLAVRALHAETPLAAVVPRESRSRYRQKRR